MPWAFLFAGLLVELCPAFVGDPDLIRNGFRPVVGRFDQRGWFFVEVRIGHACVQFIEFLIEGFDLLRQVLQFLALAIGQLAPGGTGDGFGLGGRFVYGLTRALPQPVIVSACIFSDPAVDVEPLFHLNKRVNLLSSETPDPDKRHDPPSQ